MVLVVDVGNTDTKFGVFDGEDLGARWAVHSDLNRSAPSTRPCCAPCWSITA